MEKIVEMLQELLPDVDILAEEHLVDDGMLDSFDIVSIMADLSAEYGIKIPAREIDAANFNSAKSIKALVDRILAQPQ